MQLSIVHYLKIRIPRSTFVDPLKPDMTPGARKEDRMGIFRGRFHIYHYMEASIQEMTMGSIKYIYAYCATLIGCYPGKFARGDVTKILNPPARVIDQLHHFVQILFQ